MTTHTLIAIKPAAANNIINALKCGNAIVPPPSPKGYSTSTQLLEYIHAELKRVSAHMSYRLREYVWRGVFALCLGAVFCPPALAAPDEIQVYLDDVREPGESGLELHFNYVPKSRRTPDYPGEIPPHHVFRAMPEISLGLAPNWDVGLYLPFQTGPDGSLYSNTARLRLKYLAPTQATKPFFWGVNLEAGYVPLRVSEDRYAAELRWIAGYRNSPWLLAVNPIFGFALSGPNQSSTPDLDLNFKVAREINAEWALGFEHYAGFGRLNKMSNSSQQEHVLYLVADFERKGFGVNFGIGRGLTNASDNWVVKTIISIPLKW